MTATRPRRRLTLRGWALLLNAAALFLLATHFASNLAYALFALSLSLCLNAVIEVWRSLDGVEARRLLAEGEAAVGVLDLHEAAAAPHQTQARRHGGGVEERLRGVGADHRADPAESGAASDHSARVEHAGLDELLQRRLLAVRIERGDGEIVTLARWDERKLAYPIETMKRGLYVLTLFRATGSRIVSIERDCNLSEEVVRVMICRADHMGELEIAAAKNGAQTATEIEEFKSGGTPPAATPAEPAAEAPAEEAAKA